MIIVNGKIQGCHRCGSTDVSLINIHDFNEDDEFVFWCNNCEEQTLEGVVIASKVKNINIEI